MRHSIYLHIPFCTHRCAYCDFNTYAGKGDLIPAYVEALCREVEAVGQGAPPGGSVHTIFFGGGTPSLLSAAQVEQVLGAIRNSFQVDDAAEVTLEANPGTLTFLALQAMCHAGVNRISLGVQSANGEELRMLERTHDFGGVLQAVADARRAGFDNLNIDLIYGLPEQTLATWSTTLQRSLELQPEHISAYCLSLEHGTPFGQWAKRGLMALPDPDLAADMYELVERELASAGYEHYEISNWAMPGRQCRHNLQYWKGEPYLGFGAGAHGYAGGLRYSNILAIHEYVSRITGTADRSGAPGAQVETVSVDLNDRRPRYPCSLAVIHQHEQSLQDEMGEFMIMGLRLVRAGVATTEFRNRFGQDLRPRYRTEIERMQNAGLLEWAQEETSEVDAIWDAGIETTSEVLRLTRRGRLLGNQVFMQFAD